MTGQGKGVIDACLQEGVKQLIYSGLESAEKMYGFVTLSWVRRFGSFILFLLYQCMYYPKHSI